MATIQTKRVYDQWDKTDGLRILVDGLWPRGLKKEAAHVDAWMKELAPSPALRKWFNHEPEKWQEFSDEYKAELTNSEAINELVKEIREHKKVTFLYAAKNEKHNNAVVLGRFIERLLNEDLEK